LSPSDLMNNLNLARKWRPRNFEEIVGQDISVRMLKNSLYVNKIFPVYLFAGQRGCGKTSSARVFAAALNCKELEGFRTNPKKHTVPCLQCESCRNMQNGQHPDFIEMDAASHTGVDNIRQLIESCAYMPLAGGKKVYLIDEAHMLSRAAFNAFLKVLEEPPESVVFILATTELQKIPDTVRSRSFQAFFKSVGMADLKKHVLHLCEKEDIDIDQEAASLVIQETEGSVRDALNVIEQVRFLGEKLTKEVILRALGKMSDEHILKLLEVILKQQPKELLLFLQEIDFIRLAPQNIWAMLSSGFRYLLWAKFGVKEIPNVSESFIEAIQTLAKDTTINRLNAVMQLLFDQEELFLRTPNKHLFLETVLLQICQQVEIPDLKEFLERCKNSGGVDSGPKRYGSAGSASESVAPSPQAPPLSARPVPTAEVKKEEPIVPQTSNKNWNLFLEKISGAGDPLLASIFKQATYGGIEAETRHMKLLLSNKNDFVTGKIDDTKDLWKPILSELFEGCEHFILKVSQQEIKSLEKKNGQHLTANQPLQSPPKPQYPSYQPQGGSQRSPFDRRGEAVDISDKEKWPKANLISKFFSGRLEKISN
jgi:DNA polymerase III subunit gamma/tau